MNQDKKARCIGEMVYDVAMTSDHLHQSTAFAPDQDCELVEYHAPAPTMLQYHHQKPVELQNRLYGKILYGPSLWVCGSCHDSIHAWLYWLLGERRKPPRIGRAAKAEAQRTFEWYQAEQSRIAST